MKKLHEDISKLVQEEYDRAAEKFGAANNSDHESFAVILEEYEESTEQARAFEITMESYWKSVKRNMPIEPMNLILQQMQEFATNAAAEWVQVAAMCYKAMMKKADEQRFAAGGENK